MGLIVLIIVLILVIYDRNRNKPKVETKKIIGYDTRTGIPLYEGEKIIGYNTQTGAPIISGREQPKPIEPKAPIDKTKISNSVLMIVGAALVVFATIVFLSSSWDSIPNIIKPFIILFVQLVFFGSYKICTNKLEIPKTGKVFKYLSFMFLPLFLISFSCFELIGESLSINGKYASLYFMASFFISDIVFKIYTYKFPDMAIKRTSYFLELAAVLCFVNYLNYPGIDFIIISLYTSIIYILLRTNLLDNKAYSTINIVVTILFMIYNTFVSQVEKEVIYYIPFFIYTILFFIMHFIARDENEEKINLYLFFVNYVLAIGFINLLEVPKYFFYLLCLIPLLLFAKYTKKEQVKKIFQWLIFGFTTIIIAINLIDMDGSYYDLLTFFTGTIIYIMELIFFKENKTYYKLGTYIAFSLFLFDLCYRLEMDSIAKYVLIIVAVLIYLLETATPSLKDDTSKHLVPFTLCLESIILAINTIIHENEYTIIIPLILMLIYSKFEKTDEGYILIPTFASLSLFIKDSNTLNISICSILILVYTFLSVIKKKLNIYTAVSFIAIVIGLHFLDINEYIIFTALGLWSLLHFFTTTERKEIYKLTTIVSVAGLYFKGLADLDLGYLSLVYLGYYAIVISIAKLVIKKGTKELPLFESITFAIITLVSLISVTKATDAIIMIIILFVLSLFSFVIKDKTLLYFSLASMIVHIIKQTLEFWASIPIYIYVLVIGLVLILFAMFDEKLNIKKKDNKKDNIE